MHLIREKSQIQRRVILPTVYTVGLRRR